MRRLHREINQSFKVCDHPAVKDETTSLLFEAFRRCQELKRRLDIWRRTAPNVEVTDRVTVDEIEGSGHHVYADKYTVFNELVKEACSKVTS